MKFQEELLTYEEDSLNPRPRACTKVDGTSPVIPDSNGFMLNKTGLEKKTRVDANNIRNLNEKPVKKKLSAKEKFFNSEPSGLLNSDSTNNNKKTDNDMSTLSSKERLNIAYADTQIEEYERKNSIAISECEKGMMETEETKDPVLAQLDLPRKKSVHFEGVSICLSEVGVCVLIKFES